MGATVNLIEAWEPYKAAKSALSNILQNQNIKQIAQKYLNSLKVFLMPFSFTPNSDYNLKGNRDLVIYSGFILF